MSDQRAQTRPPTTTSAGRAAWARLRPVVVDAVVDRYALSLLSHVSFHTAKGYTLSLAKQVLATRYDDVVKTMERNVHLV